MLLSERCCYVSSDMLSSFYLLLALWQKWMVGTTSARWLWIELHSHSAWKELIKPFVLIVTLIILLSYAYICLLRRRILRKWLHCIWMPSLQLGFSKSSRKNTFLDNSVQHSGSFWYWSRIYIYVYIFFEGGIHFLWHGCCTNGAICYISWIFC